MEKYEKERIFLLDVLRGFALSGILLIHHIEKFGIYLKPENYPAWLVKLDAYFWQQIFYFMSGKAYALFALLFGFSFYILGESAKKRGEKYIFRHAWRMALLFIFSLVHVVFYRGDIMSQYAILGVFLIATRILNNKFLLLLAIFMLLNPVFLYSVVQYIFSGDVFNWRISGSGAMLKEPTLNGSFWEIIQVNLQYGAITETRWSWNVGRIPTIAGLFLLGCYFARVEAFSKQQLEIWPRILFVAVALWFILHLIQNVWIPQVEGKFNQRIFKRAMTTQIDTVMMLTMISTFILFWNTQYNRFKFTKLASFGRMGLTNYIGMSVIGAIIYYGWGFRLFPYFGATASLFLGCIILYLQIQLSHRWLQTHQQGPLEALWRTLTWLKVPALRRQ